MQPPLCVASCWLYFRMHVFVFKALRRSVPGPLSSPTLRHCFLCHQWSLYSPLYFGAVMTLFTSIGTTVTPYLAADNVNLSLQDVSHIDLFHSCNFPSLLSVFPLQEKKKGLSSLFTYYFISCSFAEAKLRLSMCTYVCLSPRLLKKKKLKAEFWEIR